MFKRLIILVVLLFAGIPVFGQSVDTAWVRRYDYSSGIDIANALAVDGSGNVYVTGYVTPFGQQLPDYATVKYYPNGALAWVKTYDGTANDEDQAQAIVTHSSGNVYVTGWSVNSGTSYDYVTIKYNPATGDTVWVREYNNSTVNLNDHATAMAVDGPGNVYVTGYSYGGSSDHDYATVKYDALGNQIWVRRYNGLANGADYANAIVVDGSGDVYVTGNSYGGASGDDYATIKYYPNGDTAWVRRYNGLWNSADYAKAIGVDSYGNVYVTGQSVGSGTGPDYATIKYNSNGSLAWVQRYDGPGHDMDYALAMSVDGPGNAYVTGYSWGGSGTAEDIATIKYKPNGDTAWVRRYNGPDNKSDGGQAITIDGAGNVYVPGWSRGNLTDLDYVTLKYDMNGYVRWIVTYNGEKDSTDIASDIAVDGSGNVYVTGNSAGNGTGPDYTTIKYFQIEQRTDTLYFKAYSPVDLIVTDPVKDSIGVNFNTIPGAFYDTTQDLDNDGDRDDRVIIPNPIMGEYMVRVVPDSGGSGNYTLAVKLDGNEDRVMKANAPCPGPGQVDTVVYTVPEYLHGDANRDGKKTVSDVVFLINYLFKGGPAPDPVDLGDVNFCKENPPVQPGNPTVSDVVYLVNYLFKGGVAPCS
jgi:hypothetical protein